MGKTDIAIIGMAGRFPKAANPFELWENLKSGKEGISFFTDEELRASGVEEALINNPNYVKASGVVEDADCFDAQYFGFTKREAEALSPQHRLALESAVEALENAGYQACDEAVKVGVYVGASLNTYLLNNLVYHRQAIAESIGQYKAMTFNLNDTLPTLIAYKLGLKGPAVNINTACSTSLVAVHYACQALLTYECDLALAGGVSIQSPQKAGYLYQPGGIFSPDGHCRAFDAQSAGTVSGSGVGLVVLKRLQEAIADQDHIYAVIEGSAVNNDGDDKVGFTAPSVEGQLSAILDAQTIANVHPENIQYIETHGTGTRIGDPIEIAALTAAFQDQTNRKSYCAIGSVKSNVGHLDAAAGVTGLIKTALALQNKQIPPSLHYEKPNPNINFAETPFYVNQALQPWEANGATRRAAVSSFGIGGTNAHLIVREHQAALPAPDTKSPQLFVVSAKSEQALRNACGQLAGFIQEAPNLALSSIAYTLQAGREAHPYRWAAVADNTTALSTALQEGHSIHEVKGGNPAVVFRCNTFIHISQEQIASHYQQEPIFAESVDEVLACVKTTLGWDVSLSQPTPENIEAPRQLMLTQFAANIALARLWESWGIQPTAFIADGHGYFVAGYLSGALKLPEAIAGIIHVTHPHEQAKVVWEKARPGQPNRPIIDAQTSHSVSASTMAHLHFWENPAGIASQQTGSHDNIALPEATQLCFGATTDTLHHTGVLVLPAWGESMATAYQSLGAMWSRGITVNWHGFNAYRKSARSPLPTYPFAKERHWLQPPSSKNNASHRATLGKKDMASWYYAPVWHKAELPATTQLAPKECLLWFESPSSAAQSIHTSLAGYAQRTIVVRPGEAFHQDGHAFTIDPQNKADYIRLLESLRAEGLMPTHVVHSWLLDNPSHGHPIEGVGPVLHLGFYSLLYFAQAIGQLRINSPMAVNILTNGLANPHQDNNIAPIKATLFGPATLLPKEYPNLSCRCIDVAVPVDNAKSIVHMFDAIHDLPAEASCVAIRHETLYTLGYEPIAPQVLDKAATHKALLTTKGCYLITGGTGGMGLALGKYLATHYQAKLILVSRGAVPPSANWAQLDQSHPAYAKAMQVQKLEALGAEVLWLQADVTNLADMQAVREKAEAQFGAIDGIIHAAGLPAGGAMQLRQYDEAQQTLAPKVQGTLVLESVFAQSSLKFMVLCSSLTVATPTMGQVDYISANAFLDAFAHQSGSPYTKIAINWDAWNESGMAVNALEKASMNEGTKSQSQKKALYQTHLETGISDQEGGAVFAQALKLSIPQVLISTTDLTIKLHDKPVVAADWVRPGTEATFDTDGAQARPNLDTEYATPGTKTEQTLAKLWAQAFGIDRVGRNDDFFELGGDSLLAVTLLANINSHFDVNLPPTSFMGANTIAALATLVDDEGQGGADDAMGTHLLKKPLVPIQVGDDEIPPLILVHPAGGDVYFYKGLADTLGKQQPVYGFRAPGLEEGETPLTSVDAMATCYLESLLAFQPEGPYWLGGASYGGMVAYEMAQRLQSMGKTVAVVIMIDTPDGQSMPNNMGDSDDILMYFAESMFKVVPFTKAELAVMESEEKLGFMAQKLGELIAESGFEQASASMNAAQLSRVMAVFKHNVTAMAAYAPHAYTGKLVFFKARERRQKYDPLNPELSWISVASSGLEVHEVPGNHISMNQPPFVSTMGSKLKNILNWTQQSLLLTR